MAKIKVTLTIQEIVDDFEKLVRYDERLDTHFDFEKGNRKLIEEFHQDMLSMIAKYIPNYETHVPAEYFSEMSTYSKALMLYKMLYENFKEIFAKLV